MLAGSCESLPAKLIYLKTKVYFFFVSFFDLLPMSSIGAAIAIEEYVPMMMPKPMANVKPLRAGPPKMYMISTTMKVVNDVRIVLEIVWLMLSVMVAAVSWPL